MDSPSKSQALVCLIARYLLGNPLACDTADGIRKWWFAPELVVTEDQLENALNQMKQNGLIEESIALDEHVRYRRVGTDAQLMAAAR